MIFYIKEKTIICSQYELPAKKVNIRVYKSSKNGTILGKKLVLILEVYPVKKTFITIFLCICSSLNAASDTCSKAATLVTALSRGNISYVQTEIKSLDNPDLANKDGISLLIMASYKGLDAAIPVITTLLKKRANVDARTTNNTAFNFGPLLSNKSNGSTALMLAAWSGNDAIVNLLLRAKAQVDMLDSLGQTALTYAILGHPLWPNCPMTKSRIDTINLLLNNGANPNMQDSNGLTPLYYYQQIADLKRIGSSNSYMHDKDALMHDEIYNRMVKS
jgi:hypothetical protein